MKKKVYKSPTVDCREIGLTPILIGSTKTGGDITNGTGSGHQTKSRNFGYTIILDDSY